MNEIFNNKIIKYLFILSRRLVYAALYFVKLLINSPDARLIVLCYHGIASSRNFFDVSEEKFKRQIDHLLSFMAPLSYSDLEDHILGKRTIDYPSFLLTFDDGYRSVLGIKNFLDERGIKPVLFVLASPEEIDRKNLNNSSPLLSWAEIECLRESGWAIGSHGSRHLDFFSASDQALEQEIFGSKASLEARLGGPIMALAYPKGAVDGRIARLAEAAGYRLAFSMVDGQVEAGVQRYAIPRIGINGTFSLIEFKSSLLGINMRARRFVKTIINRICSKKIF